MPRASRKGGPKAAAPAPPADAARGTSWSWASVGKSLLAVPTVIKAVVAVVAVGFALAIAYAELSGRLIVIEPFDVVEVLQKSHGYTSRVIANKLTDHLTRVRTTARTSMQRRQFVAPGAENAHFRVLGGDANLEALLPYLWAISGKQRLRIAGEIVVSGNPSQGLRLEVTTRVGGTSPQTVSGGFADLEALVRQSAEHIYLVVQPYVLASYFYEFDARRSFEVIQHVLRTEPQTDDARAYNLWGLISRDAGQHADAVTNFRDAVRVSTEPDIKARASTNLAASLLALRRHDEALEAVTQAVAAAPKHAEAHHVWGLILAARHDPARDRALHQAAIDKMREAIRLDDKFVAGYLSLGDELARRGDTDAAIGQYQRAADLDRGSAAAHLRIARTLRRAQRLEDARRYLQRVIAIVPASHELETTLGIVLFDEGELAEALDRFNRARALAPREPTPYFYAGQIYRIGEEADKAVSEFTRYVELAPEGPTAEQARRFIRELAPGSPNSRARASGS